MSEGNVRRRDRGKRDFGIWSQGDGHAGPRGAAMLVWLAFIVFPVVDAIGNHESLVGHLLAIAGAVVFVGAYAVMVLSWRGRRDTPIPLLALATQLVLACALTLGDRSSWGFLFIYCAACAPLLPSSLAWEGWLFTTACAGGVSALGGANGGTAIGFAASAAGVGLLMLLMRDLRVRNEELCRARAELARLAVAEERQRFARDLHDLLGHSLSVIALKAELAGRLLPDRPGEAAGEVAELERVARSALGEVRQAVSGYHQPKLDRELAGARMALTAAGIEADVRESNVALDPAVEALLAWTVREGATNVIRHSRAHRCTLTISATLTDAGVEVVDDGAGAAVADAGVRVRNGGRVGNGAGGHGLDGLAERARLLGATIEAGALAGGGFRLAVTVPVSPA